LPMPYFQGHSPFQLLAETGPATRTHCYRRPVSISENQPSLVWLRNDLRLADNPALTALASEGRPLVVVYIHAEPSDGIRPLGSASTWWLHHSLTALDAALQKLGGRLTLRRGPAAQVLPALVAELDATSVRWNRRYTPSRDIDAGLKSSSREQGRTVASHQGNVLGEPWHIRNGQGEPYRVFSPYWLTARERPVRELLPSPVAAGLRETWTPGETGALDLLDSFVAEHLPDYHRRDEPAVAATSGLSPHLRFGEISPTQIWQRLRGEGLTSVPTAAGAPNPHRFSTTIDPKILALPGTIWISKHLETTNAEHKEQLTDVELAAQTSADLICLDKFRGCRRFAKGLDMAKGFSGIGHRYDAV
jgi:hypothetical protein